MAQFSVGLSIFSITKTGTGTLTFSGANTYTGGTTLGTGTAGTGGTLKLGASDVIPNTGTFAFSGGTLSANDKTDVIGGRLPPSVTFPVIAAGISA